MRRAVIELSSLRESCTLAGPFSAEWLSSFFRQENKARRGATRRNWVRKFSLVDMGGNKVSGDAQTSKQVETNKPIIYNKDHPLFSAKEVIN